MSTSRRILSNSLAMGSLCAAMPGVLTAAMRPEGRPNIVFFLVDDFGKGGLKCMGSDLHETPNIDRLVQRGMQFSNGYAACTVCSPSRAAILTGRYPARTRITDWIPGQGRNLVETEPDIAKTLLKELQDWRASVNAQMPTPVE